MVNCLDQKKLLQNRGKELVLYSSFIAILGLFLTFIIFLPLIILANTDHTDVTISNQAFTVMQNALTSNLYIHTCIGALCCTFPLFCDHIMDISMAKFSSTTIAQSCLILSIAIPTIVLYQASLQGQVSVGLFSCATNSQELLYFGAILSFHSHFSKSIQSKIITLLIYIIFAIGIMLASFYNTHLIPQVMNQAGLAIIFIGVFALYGCFFLRLYSQLIHLWKSSRFFSSFSFSSSSDGSISLRPADQYSLRENLYIYILIANLSFRLLLFQFMAGDGDTSAIRGQPYYIMINTISVVFLSILNSRQLKVNYYQIQNRFETKRNFVRYISHEIRTPLNCVQMGIELALLQLKNKHDVTPHSPFPMHVPSGFLEQTASHPLNGPFQRFSSRASESLEELDLELDQSTIELLEDTHLSCQTAVEILNDILSYDKLEASDMKLNHSIVAVKSLMEKCISPFQVQAKQKNISLRFKGPSQIPDYFSKVNVSVDVNRFGQVIRNIISNALKFTPNGGIISISATQIRNSGPTIIPNYFSYDTTESLSKDNQQAIHDLEANISIPSQTENILRIDISDTGPGITKEQQQSLLREVVQFHDPLSSNVNGAGLGLWISKSIIDLHGGTLSVSSEGIPGKGSTFTICLAIHSYESLSSTRPTSVGQSSVSETETFLQDSPTSLQFSGESTETQSGPTVTLPAHSSPTAATTAPAPAPAPATAPTPLPTPLTTPSSTRLNQQLSAPPIALCVDDSSLNRKFIGKFLTKYFTVIYCVNGLEAVEYVEKSLTTTESVSIIFMDSVMPVMDGLEATSRIRSLGYSGPIVGVTGNCLPEQIEEFTMKGASTIVQKPIKLESFGKLILDVMGPTAPNGL